MIYMKLERLIINAQRRTVVNMDNFKLGKDEILYTTYKNHDQQITHALSKKLNTEINKMWILWSVESDGTLKKLAHGSNPLKLEDKIDYIKEIKDAHQ